MTAARGPLAVVVGADTYLGGRIALSLGRRGCAIVALSRSGLPAAAAERVAAAGADVVAGAIAGDGTGAVAEAIARGARDRAVTIVVHAEVDEAALAPRALLELDPGEWEAACHGPTASAVWTAQAAFGAMAGAGGTLGFVCPSVGMTGAPGRVPLSATSEAIRVLAKSAARNWGAVGITVNAFAPDVAACGPPTADRPAAAVNEAAFTSVDAAEDVAALLVHLGGPDGALLTGATFGTDGGMVMAP